MPLGNVAPKWQLPANMPWDPAHSKWQSSFGCPLTHTSLGGYLSKEHKKELKKIHNAVPTEELQRQYYNEAIKFSFIQGQFDSADLDQTVRQERLCKPPDDRVKEVMVSSDSLQPATSRRLRKVREGCGSTASGVQHEILAHEDPERLGEKVASKGRWTICGKIGARPKRKTARQQPKDVTYKITQEQQKMPAIKEPQQLNKNIFANPEAVSGISRLDAGSARSASHESARILAKKRPPGHTGPIPALAAVGPMDDPRLMDDQSLARSPDWDVRNVRASQPVPYSVLNSGKDSAPATKEELREAVASYSARLTPVRMEEKIQKLVKEQEAEARKHGARSSPPKARPASYMPLGPPERRLFDVPVSLANIRGQKSLSAR